MSLVVGGALLHMAQAGVFADIAGLRALAPWRSVPLVLALPGLIAAGLLLTVREPERVRSVAEVARVSTTAEAIKALWIRRGIVAPVWAALAFYSAGDAAFSGWAPSLLGRVYQVPTAEAGGLLGIVYIATGMGGTLLGGVVGDRLERKGGPSRRLLAACVGSILAILSGLTFIHGSTVSVLCCFGLWVFMANFCQVIGIAALQELLPGEMRGLNISCIAFVDLFLGSTSGTGATAVLTQYVFRSPLAVGSSIGLVGGFSALAAAVLFGRSLLRARSTPG